MRALRSTMWRYLFIHCVVIHEEEWGRCDDVENDKASAGRRHFVVQWNSDGRKERYISCFETLSFRVMLCDFEYIQVKTTVVVLSYKVADRFVFKRLVECL